MLVAIAASLPMIVIGALLAELSKDYEVPVAKLAETIAIANTLD